MTPKVLSLRHVVKRILPTRPQHLYSVIKDVNSYAQFLPLCKSSHILRTSECGTMFDASLCVTMADIPPFNWIQEDYVSRVTMKEPTRTSNTNHSHSHSHSHDSIQHTDKNEWIVEAKSIKSKLFLGLTSRWRLTDGGRLDRALEECLKDRNILTTDTDTIMSELQRGDVGKSLVQTSTQATYVEFEIEMRVQDPIIVAALNQVLGDVAETQVAAFEKRCLELHR